MKKDETLNYFNFFTNWKSVYDDNAGDDKTGDDKTGDDKTGDDKTGDDKTGDDKSKTFTQEEVNAIVAKENSKHRKSLEELQQNKSLDEEAQKKLKEQIDRLSSEKESEIDKAQRERKQLVTKHETEVKGLTADRDLWKGLYSTSRVNGDLTDAAITTGAVNPKQIVEILRPSTSLVEDTDKDGKPTGKFLTRVKIVETDEKGSRDLLLSPADAVKRMVDDKENYGNLFKSTLKTGLGNSNSTTQKGRPTNYSEYRQQKHAK